MPAILAIPARYHSTRLPRKLLLAETGKPLICHTVDLAITICRRAPTLFSGVIVAADHPEIFAAVTEYAAREKIPARAVMTAESHPSGTDRIAEAVRDSDAEIIVNLQGDEPEMPADAIISLTQTLIASPDLPMATLGYPLTFAAAANPNVVKIVTDARNRALYFSRLPIPFDRDKTPDAEEFSHIGHCGVYAYRRFSLEKFVALPTGKIESRERLEQLRALENAIKIQVVLLARPPAKGIDTPADYHEFVERYGGIMPGVENR